MIYRAGEQRTVGYLRPTSVDEAVGALAASPAGGSGWVVLAGGTDHYPARVGPRAAEDILDISRVAGLRGVAETDSGWRIGALTTWTEVIEADLPPLFDGLKLAAREVGGVQIQNRGTVAGNLCNASPAADGIPPLLSLDAMIELASAKGTRRLKLAEFIQGNRRTARRSDELVTAIHLPRPANAAKGDFLKLGARKYLVISIVMAAGVIERTADRKVAAARIAVGACSAAAQRLSALEQALAGQPLDTNLRALVTEMHLAPLAPIDDVRGSAGYRLDCALTIVRRLVDRLAS
ncbi:MAG: xanthine dehydrogenase family protein subunit M [Rhodospirillales bacterium]|nr:xanthine dehydrogenase family protein subunit M [Rhodospirillales bacterium]